MDRGAWWATVYGVTKSQTGLSDEHFHFFHPGPSTAVLAEWKKLLYQKLLHPERLAHGVNIPRILTVFTSSEISKPQAISGKWPLFRKLLPTENCFPSCHQL